MLDEENLKNKSIYYTKNEIEKEIESLTEDDYIHMSQELYDLINNN